MRRKKGYIIGLCIIILLFGLWVIKEFKLRDARDDLFISRDEVSGLKGLPNKENPDKERKVGYVILNGEKAKAPSFKFIDQNGDTITNEDYKNMVYVVEFFYTSCPTICPIMNQNLIAVSQTFKGNKKFGIASFTIDPEYDTPKVLKEYAEKHGITNPNWHFLTGNRSKIYKLARQGFKLNALKDPAEPGGILHDGMFVLIDKNGYIRSRKDEFGNPILYYRGYIHRGTHNDIGQTSQVNKLIEDIKWLLHVQ